MSSRGIPCEAAAPPRCRIPARQRDALRLFRPDEVEALLVVDGICTAWTLEGRYPLEGTLQAWESLLVPFGFLRIHRAALVNLEAVRALSMSGEAVLGTGRLPVSQQRQEALRRALGLP